MERSVRCNYIFHNYVYHIAGANSHCSMLSVTETYPWRLSLLSSALTSSLMTSSPRLKSLSSEHGRWHRINGDRTHHRPMVNSVRSVWQTDRRTDKQTNRQTGYRNRIWFNGEVHHADHLVVGGTSRRKIKRERLKVDTFADTRIYRKRMSPYQQLH